jgi:pimeloyl-ACP methyl ester carboxylesterase
MDVVDLPHKDLGPRGAPAVILLHGFPLDHTQWAPQARALEAAGVRVIVPDLRGLGRAPPGHGPGSMAAYAGDVLRLAGRAGIGRFAVAGFSMGGYVAFELLRQAPERVRALALVDTRADADSDEGRKGRAATIAKLRAEGAQVLVEAMLPKLLTPAAPPALVEQVRATILRTSVEGAVFALEAMAARPDSRALLPALRMPVLVVVGEEDAITPPDASRAMAAAAPGASLVLVKGAAHLSTLERADEVARAMVAWAARLH